MRVILIRHPAPLTEPGICYGRLDVPLHPAAFADVIRIARDPALLGIHHVWSSPATRCRTVADAIGVHTAPRIDARLQELDFGDWEGRLWDTIEKSEFDRWGSAPVSFAPPRGESGAAITARLRAFYLDLTRDGHDCVVVSHGGPLKILAALLEKRPVDLLETSPPLGSIRTITVNL
jgi:alpha-ribazole phosphatase